MEFKKCKNILGVSMLALSAMATSSTSFAGITCVGEHYNGTTVRVDVYTVGTMGAIDSAYVQMNDRSGELMRWYEIPKNEISQFYEGCREGDCFENGKAMIGLAAYKDSNFEILINYLGKDYVSDDRDIIDILKDPARVPQDGNSMRVWSGVPGLEGDDAFYRFKDVVCEMSHDV